MDRSQRELSKRLFQQRHSNAAWQLLASPLAPYLLTCLKQMFEPGETSRIEDMERALADMLDSAGAEDVEGSNYLLQARREVQGWIRRGLVIERGGELFPTDALQLAMSFVDGLQDRIMTSTASRLATVQREIADLALQLSPDAEAREKRLEDRIATLQIELDQVRAGQFEVREGDSAIEGIREVYTLAMSLHADFRRVEDSFREAEKMLRQALITEEQHRGSAVDSLLDSNDALLETTEGQVFSVFHRQLIDSDDLAIMREHLKEISRHKLATRALGQQRDELRQIVLRLMTESRRIVDARSRSERDVKDYIRSGLAAEHFLVGQRLRELSDAALHVNWSSAATRRGLVPLNLLGTGVINVPAIERLRWAGQDDKDFQSLDLSPVTSGPEVLEAEFWSGFDTLDRYELYEEVLGILNDQGSLSIGALMTRIAPVHDLEAVAYLLGLAREAESLREVDNASWDQKQMETFAVKDRTGALFSYEIPAFTLHVADFRQLSWENA